LRDIGELGAGVGETVNGLTLTDILLANM